MDNVLHGDHLPDSLRHALTLTLTVLAALLYAAVLGTAIVRTFREPAPTFTEATVRTAALLSGLVGSVVTAGFAKGRQPASVPITTTHPMQPGRARTSWRSLRPPSLGRCRLLGLATLIGLPVAAPLSWSVELPDADEPAAVPDLEPGTPWSANLWVALLYFAVYLIVGALAFVLTLVRANTPDFLANAAWVWLGTVASSGYTFFAPSGMPRVDHQTARRATRAA
jgi:hypothetical protein